MTLRDLFRDRNFIAYFCTVRFNSLASIVEDVALGWQVYLLRHNSFDLGLIGLVMFLPAVLFAIPAGVAADRYDRRIISVICLGIHAIALGAIAVMALRGERSPTPYFIATAFIGTSDAWRGPALRSLLPMLVSESVYMRAYSFSSTAGQMVVIVGPAIAGVLVAHSTALAFSVSAILLALAMVSNLAITMPPAKPAHGAGVVADERAGLRYALEGLRYIFKNRVVLGAITLDLFAVLFGGATALLPVYADAILHVGAQGLGLLRCAPAIGAASVGLLLARRPIQRHAGSILFATVAGFGAFTIVFAYSRMLWLSMLALALTGGFDMVSMVIRTGLVTLATPNELRGRVNAVENVFIGASNELGAFESGALASLVGTVPSVALGGLGTLIVIAVSFVSFGALRRKDRLIEPATAS